MEPLSAMENLSPKEAVALQKQLALKVCREDSLGAVHTIAGLDVSCQRFGTIGYAAIVVLSWPALEIIETVGAGWPLGMPYIPGLLSFREIPVLLQAWQKLKAVPDLLIVDGHGIAHPRRLGIASHLGVLLDRPSIGCAKSLLRGQFGDLGLLAGSRAPLLDKGELLGYAVRTKNKVNPVYVSTGHRVTADTAVDWVLATARGYRLPEPTRKAHLASNAVRLGALE